MTLAAGSRLVPTRSSARSARGNGEVYRAKDPGSHARSRSRCCGEVFPDADRLRRLSRRPRPPILNPTNITQHDIGSHDGAPTSSRSIEARRCARFSQEEGPPSQRSSTRTADRHGIAAAPQGIVHSDLKPENLFVTNEATQDPGSARKAHAFGEGGPQTNMQTAAGTSPAFGSWGTSLQAHEQITGKPRTAIGLFSFGAIFTNDSATRVPRRSAGERWRRHQGGHPDRRTNQPSLRGSTIVRKLLRRTPTRFHAAHDRPSTTGAVGTSGVARVDPERQRGRLTPALLVALVPSRARRWVSLLERERRGCRGTTARTSGASRPSGFGKRCVARRQTLAFVIAPTTVHLWTQRAGPPATT